LGFGGYPIYRPSGLIDYLDLAKTQKDSVAIVSEHFNSAHPAAAGVVREVVGL
jgi:hypothetical protein